MLLCIVCNKVIADNGSGIINYGGCPACPLVEVAAKMDDLKKRKDGKNAEHTQTASK